MDADDDDADDDDDAHSAFAVLNLARQAYTKTMPESTIPLSKRLLTATSFAL